jgi:hypothetical protein
MWTIRSDDTDLLPARRAPAPAVLDEEVACAYLAGAHRFLGRVDEGSGLLFSKLGWRCPAGLFRDRVEEVWSPAGR